MFVNNHYIYRLLDCGRRGRIAIFVLMIFLSSRLELIFVWSDSLLDICSMLQLTKYLNQEKELLWPWVPTEIWILVINWYLLIFLILARVNFGSMLPCSSSLLEKYAFYLYLTFFLCFCDSYILHILWYWSILLGAMQTHKDNMVLSCLKDNFYN